VIVADFPDNPGALPAVKLCNRKGSGKPNPIFGDGPIATGDARKDLVKHLQTALLELGFQLGTTGENHDGIDGVFGDLTRNAVKDFQQDHKDWDDVPLTVDKLVGPKTSDAINRELVGKWYDLYETPKELIEDRILITVTPDALKEKVPVKTDGKKKGRIVIVGQLPQTLSGLLLEVKKVCNRLASKPGWRELLLEFGLDITAKDLKQELEKELDADKMKKGRQIPGFEDFSPSGKKGIEHCDPARSLLFHALASPNVRTDQNNNDLTIFPSLQELEIVENYVYGSKPLTLDEIKSKFEVKASEKIAIAVFASEYRPGRETVHRKHADVCFSRAGLMRVGTSDPFYSEKDRGFSAFNDGDPHAIRVLPARYSAFIAVRRKGNKNTFGPLRFRDKDRRTGDDLDPKDGSLDFWVPIYKVFSGKECIKGNDLHVTLRGLHVNEKFKKIFEKLNGEVAKSDSEVDPKKYPVFVGQLSNPPFRFTDGIADWSTNKDFGTGLMVPAVHSSLVEKAQINGKPLTFSVPSTRNHARTQPGPGGSTVPKNRINLFSSSLEFTAQGAFRSVPEYAYIRDIIPTPSPGPNEQENVIGAIIDGGFDAQMFKDFAGDGVIEVDCPELSSLDKVAAYSMVTAVDFFPQCDQIEVMSFWEELPGELANSMWSTGTPDPLSDERTAPNLTIIPNKFDSGDVTVTAIVSLPFNRAALPEITQKLPPTRRHAHLPDAASGIHAPGWDVTVDKDPVTNSKHLAAYGLGSPFPEDAKLCAFLSTFWPAVSPDAAREFEPRQPGSSTNYTVVPLTDEEIGNKPGSKNNISWDGVEGPKVRTIKGIKVVEYSSLAHADYVQNAARNKFSLALTGKIETEEYLRRILAMAKVYQALGIKGEKDPKKEDKVNQDKKDKARFAVLSFEKVESSLPELATALKESSVSKIEATIYRFEIFKIGAIRRAKDNSDKPIIGKFHVEMNDTLTFFIGITTTDPAFYKNSSNKTIILKKEGANLWKDASL
jgi:hypothetical protein